MLVKVCGMRDSENIEALDALNPDFMGFIFYPASKRYVSGPLPVTKCKRIGVFVNEQLENVLTQVVRYQLDGVQLHGYESPTFCRKLKACGILVWKAFQVANATDFSECHAYAPYCDFFLFDTKSAQYGGSGRKFDWRLLDAYEGEIPFFLSGGISLSDVSSIHRISNPKMIGVDLNSAFELSPGVKDIDQIKMMLAQIQ